jgi:hexosaminidase
MAISYPSYTGDSIKYVVQQFADDFKTATALTLNLDQNSSTAPILLKLNSTLSEEEYNLNVTRQNVAIEASSPVGFYYAFQTLKQLMPRNVMAAVPDASVTSWSLPVVSISDKPRFAWRGFMLDVGRHFFDKDEVKRVLDIMSVYKMNRFHWHLTEDQGWRIDIKKYPQLTSVGAWRDSKVLAYGSTHTDGLRYGGYYTQDDIREVIAYAKKYFIEIVPEIDMPGHSQAAVASYPEILACDPQNSHSVWTSQGVSSDVINVCNPSAIQFAKDVIDELTDLFPFGYIHLGGDECPTTKWQNNTQCQDTLKKLGSTNYRDLQLHFYGLLQKYISTKSVDKQRKIIFWNETLGGNTNLLTAPPTIMAWTGADAAAKNAAQKGFDNILSPQIPYYLNRKQSSDAGEPSTQGSGSETVEAVYNYKPANGIDATLLPYYKGVQANFWTEWVIEPTIVEYLMLPRIAAVAEAGWTPQSLRDYQDFVSRVRNDSVLYNLKGWNYGRHIMNIPTKGGSFFTTGTTPVNDVTTLKSGDVVLIENVTSTSGRSGFLNSTGGQILTTATTLKDFVSDNSAFLWQISVDNGTYTFKSLNAQQYIPSLTSNGNGYSVSKTAGAFKIVAASSGTWYITSTDGKTFWNGNVGAFTSWSTGHPYKFYNVQCSPVPYYRLTNTSVGRNLTAESLQTVLNVSDESLASQIWQVASSAPYSQLSDRISSRPYVVLSPSAGMMLDGDGGKISEKGTINSCYLVRQMSSTATDFLMLSGNNRYLCAGTDNAVVDTTLSGARSIGMWTYSPATELLVQPVLNNSLGKCMAGICFDYPVALPAGVDAYYVSAIDDSTAYLESFPDSVIPARYPVLLVLPDMTPMYCAPASTSGNMVQGNKLQGTASKDETISADYYLFSSGTFTKSSVSTIPSHSVYLPRTSNQKDVLEFSFGTPTNISSVCNDKVNTAKGCFDMVGRQVTKPSKGIYIINGKKQIIH